MESKTGINRWGAASYADGTVHFRVRATGHTAITLRLSGHDRAMQPRDDGWFECWVEGIKPGAEYQYVLADGQVLPDPASRAQKAGVNGPSLIVDPLAFQWQHTDWRGRAWEESVIYELHIGTFTSEGTFQAAISKLPYLAGLGITQIELLPLSQFGGNRGWGYDGVLLYAPHSAYGTPDELKAFVDAAHGYGLSVVLDIVLNHFGPEGNYLSLLSPDFFDDSRSTPWGAGIAYEVEAVRHYIADAPLYWLKEYHLDGLRFDAIDQIKDDSQTHLLIEIAQHIRADITDRPVHLTTEDCRNIISLHPRNEDGSAPLFTAEWNDDVHNALHVLATGEMHAYYQDFATAPETLVARALTEGFAYQGDVSAQSGEMRGVDSRNQPPVTFVDFIQNHDQVGNRAFGERLISLAGAERTQVLFAALLLSPHIPLLFMGEEYGETRPFLFFTDFHGDLANAVREGRAREFAGHSGYEGKDVPDPNALTTFTASKLDWAAPGTPQGKAWLALSHKLLTLRKQHIVPLLATAKGNSGRIVQTAPGFFAVSWQFPNGTLSLAVNIGADMHNVPALPGETVFALPGLGNELPPNSMVVRLAPGDAS